MITRVDYLVAAASAKWLQLSVEDARGIVGAALRDLRREVKEGEMEIIRLRGIKPASGKDYVYISNKTRKDAALTMENELKNRIRCIEILEPLLSLLSMVGDGDHWVGNVNSLRRVFAKDET